MPIGNAWCLLVLRESFGLQQRNAVAPTASVWRGNCQLIIDQVHRSQAPGTCQATDVPRRTLRPSDDLRGIKRPVFLCCSRLSEGLGGASKACRRETAPPSFESRHGWSRDPENCAKYGKPRAAANGLSPWTGA